MRLRRHEPTLKLIQKAMDKGTLVAAICHAPWILISANVVRGRTISCPGDMGPDVTNAGGTHVKDPACTRRKPDHGLQLPVSARTLSPAHSCLASTPASQGF